MKQIIQQGDGRYVSFLSGQRNWRKEEYSLYKANRRDQVDPPYRQNAKEYLVTNYKSQVSDGLEADDEIGIYKSENPECIIASIDKDFHQLGGYFYNFVKDERYYIDPLDGTRAFYKQLILGDQSDNVPGYDGAARSRPTKQIQHWHGLIDESADEADMWNIVVQSFDTGGGDVALAARMIWIWRKNPDKWIPPTERLAVPE